MGEGSSASTDEQRVRPYDDEKQAPIKNNFSRCRSGSGRHIRSHLTRHQSHADRMAGGPNTSPSRRDLQEHQGPFRSNAPGSARSRPDPLNPSPFDSNDHATRRITPQQRRPAPNTPEIPVHRPIRNKPITRDPRSLAPDPPMPFDSLDIPVQSSIPNKRNTDTADLAARSSPAAQILNHSFRPLTLRS